MRLHYHVHVDEPLQQKAWVQSLCFETVGYTSDFCCKHFDFNFRLRVSGGSQLYVQVRTKIDEGPEWMSTVAASVNPTQLVREDGEVRFASASFVQNGNSHNKSHRPLIARTSPAHRPLIAH